MKKLVMLGIVAILGLNSCGSQAVAVEPTMQGVDTAALSTELPTAEALAVETAAPSESADAVEVKDGGRLVRAISSEPTTLDPHGVAGSGQNVVLPYLLDTLVYRDIDNQYHPYLAESWSISADGLTYEFVLKEGVTFSDGTALDGKAVQHTYQRLQQVGRQSPLNSAFANVDSIEADGQSVTLHLKQPSSTLLGSLSTAYAGIISPTAFAAAGEDFGLNPIGSGAYILEEWQAGQAIRLVRNPAYAWGPDVLTQPGPAHIEELVFQIIPDPSAQSTGFESGEVDMLFVNQPSQVARFQANPEAVVQETSLNSLIYLGFNVQSAPLNDVKVRTAIAQLIDKAALVDLVLGDTAVPVFSPLAPTLPGYDAELESLAPVYDPAAGAELMLQAGLTRSSDGGWLLADGSPFTLELLTSTRSPNEDLAAVLQDQLRQAGITVTIHALDSNAVVEAASAGNYQMMLSRYDWNDADILNVYLSSSRIGSTNRSFYSNPELDELLARAAVEMDASVRGDLYSQAQQILIVDQPWIPLYTPTDYMVMRVNLRGVILGPMGRLLLTDAWLQE